MKVGRSLIGTPVGNFEVVFEGERVLSFGWSTSSRRSGRTACPYGLARRFTKALEEYFSSGKWDFSWFGLPAPCRPVSEKALLAYDYLRERVGPGSVISYRDLGRATGIHPRGIGSIMRSNPWPVIVPCHRVIGSDGSLVGYAGGLERKKWLLSLEGWPGGWK